jgi:hypothetical protein
VTDIKNLEKSVPEATVTVVGNVIPVAEQVILTVYPPAGAKPFTMTIAVAVCPVMRVVGLIVRDFATGKLTVSGTVKLVD